MIEQYWSLCFVLLFGRLIVSPIAGAAEKPLQLQASATLAPAPVSPKQAPRTMPRHRVERCGCTIRRWAIRPGTRLLVNQATRSTPARNRTFGRSTASCSATRRQDAGTPMPDYIRAAYFPIDGGGCLVLGEKPGRGWEELGWALKGDPLMFDGNGREPGGLPDVSVVYADGRSTWSTTGAIRRIFAEGWVTPGRTSRKVPFTAQTAGPRRPDANSDWRALPPHLRRHSHAPQD